MRYNFGRFLKLIFSKSSEKSKLRENVLASDLGVNETCSLSVMGDSLKCMIFLNNKHYS